MILTHTAKLRLHCDAKPFAATASAYTKAFNYACRVAWDQAVSDRFALHHLVYYRIRETFGLQADLAANVIAKAMEAVKAARTRLALGLEASCPKSRRQSIRHTRRNTYSIDLVKGVVSLATISGRVKVGFAVPDYYRQYLGWRHMGAELVIRGSKVYLHVSFQTHADLPKPTGKVIGIDRGINQIAVTSDNKFYGGGHPKHVAARYQRLRKELQACGTRSAQRHLARLSGKEKRFRADVDHRISKAIINDAQSGDTIVLEDLTGIRNRCGKSKAQRQDIARWSFFRLEMFLRYKAARKGVRVASVDPAYTSKTCNACDHVCDANRKGSAFQCIACGHRAHADLNGSRNIRDKHLGATCVPGGAAVNQPIAPDRQVG